MKRRLIIRIVAALAVCLIAQGCDQGFWDSIADYQQMMKKIEESNRVPLTATRFHINDVEYYRDNPDVVYQLIDGRPFIFCEFENTAEIYAKIRSVNADGTKGSTTGEISLRVPSNLVGEGKTIDKENISGYVYIYPRIAKALNIRFDSFEITFTKFTGFAPGDSVQIRFSFEQSLYEVYYPEGETTPSERLYEKHICTDGFFKEVAAPGKH